MIKSSAWLALVLAGTSALTRAQASDWVNYIRQIQMPDGETIDIVVNSSGQSLSLLSIVPGGAKFELWTVNTTTLQNYLLDSTIVSAFLPQATVAIRSEDPYAVLPRTRADRPFYVDVTVSGLLAGETDPPVTKQVTLVRHVQSYGTTGTGTALDRTQATLLAQASITTNGAQTLTYTLNSIPGADRTKVRGEERFSVFTMADFGVPESQIDSKFIQIWPVADGHISGITSGQAIATVMPAVTFTLNDLYPSSQTYAQVYKGSPQLGTTGTVVPGSNLVINDSVPSSRVLTVNNYDSLIDSNGTWTMELLTQTPFGIDRLAAVSFTVQNHAYQSKFFVSGNGSYIPDGDSTPAAGDATDFGSAAAGGGTIVRTFTLQNTGTSALPLNGTPSITVTGLHAADFTVTRQPGSLVAVDGSTTFELTFAPTAAAIRTAVLNIAGGTPDETPYHFSIQGTAITSAHQNWRQAHFGSIANSGDGADLNDFDHDGLANLIEFAFALDPRQNSNGQLPASQKTGGNHIMSFTQPTGVGGITYGAEWSTTLLPGSWNQITDTAQPPQHTFSVPIDSKPQIYLRLKVTSP